MTSAHWCGQSPAARTDDNLGAATPHETFPNTGPASGPIAGSRHRSRRSMCAITVPDLPNLHDATLKDIHVDWGAATATLHLRAVPGVDVVLIAQGLRELQVAHRDPWGPSVSVNGVELVLTDDGEHSLCIEMQSGDDITVVAGQLIVE